MFIHSKDMTFWNLTFVTKNNFRGIRMGIWPIRRSSSLTPSSSPVINKYIICSSPGELAICVHNRQNRSLNYGNGTQMKLSWRVNASVCTFGENFTNIRNGMITWIFFSTIECFVTQHRENINGETSKFAWKTAWQMSYFRILSQKPLGSSISKIRI